MNDILVSIIIPVYNKEKYLRTILNQIKNQNFHQFECILIDDGSTDLSGVICDEFANKDSRFRVMHTLNQGVSHARNIGLDNAIGEYVTFIDGDDEIDLDYIRNLYECINNSYTDLVISGFSKFWDDKDSIINVVYPLGTGRRQMEAILPSFASIQKETGIFGFCFAKIFPREKVSRLRFNESIKLAEDFDFYLNLYANINEIYFDNKTLYRYRQMADNSSAVISDYDIDYLTQLKIRLHYKNFLVSHNSFIGNNRVIVEREIKDYVYFAMFYCQIDIVKERCEVLYKLCIDNIIGLEADGLQESIILSCVRKNNKQFVGIFIRLYRIARYILKR